jgi:pimeloyl-ACP methyl ester carboxylesterase
MNTGHDGSLSTAQSNPVNRTPQPTGWEPPAGELGPVAPRICRPKDKPVEIPETRYATTADGQRLAYQTLGEHPVDVLSMGAYFSNLEHIWAEPTIARMNRRLSTLGRLILLDGRGTGLSDPIPEGRLPTLEERIDDMKAVLDAVAAERVALVSFANSGPLCCLFAATYPDRTLALVLCNTSPRMAWAPDYPWGIDPDEYEHRLADTATRWGTREYAAEIVRNGSPSRAEDTALIDWWEASMRQSASPEAAATLLRMYYEMDVRDILPAIHVPTLVLSRGGELAEQARNLYIEEEAPKVRFLIRDRDAKFARSFDEVFRTEGVHVIKTPIRAPNANAFAERLIRTIRAEVTDRALVLGPRHLDRLLRSFAAHYNAHRPHRGIDLQSPDTIGTVPEVARIAYVRRRRVVGGLINEYRARAA